MATARINSRPAAHSAADSIPASAGRRPARRRASRIVVGLIAAATSVTGIAVALPGSSAAAPAPTIHEVQARIAAINVQAEKITEAYDGARSELTALQGKAAAAHTTLIKDEQLLGGMQGGIARMASAAYESEGLSGATALLENGSPEAVMTKASDLGQVARSRSTELSHALAVERAVASDKAVYDAQVSAENKTISAIAQHRSQIQSLLSKEQQVLSTLKAAQRRELIQQQQRQRQRALAARAAYTPPAAAAPKASSATYNGPATGSAAAAVQFAYAQLGKPYVYGATGPSSYDCSGLTMRSWEAAGVSLPRTAADQQAAIPAVSLSALQPGDLVFFGDPAYHVAMYIGGGRIIQAPHTGAYVEITPLSYMQPSGAGRP